MGTRCSHYASLRVTDHDGSTFKNIVKNIAEQGLLKFVQQRKAPVLLAIFILFWVTALIGFAKVGWLATWGMVDVPGIYPPFHDMRSIQGALSSIAAGYDPHIYNPGDPAGRVMDYPSVWIVIAKVFRFGNETSFMTFVSTFIFAYLFSCCVLLKKSPSLYLLLAMLSGASLLAVERGNNDLVVFSLVTAALHLRWDRIKAGIALLAVILKIYPVFALYGFFRRNVKLLVLTAISSAIYLMFILREIAVIKLGNTANGGFAYGVQLGAMLLAAICVILMIASYLLWKTGVVERVFLNESGDYEREMFLVGGSLYFVTFFLSLNWDYRLIFLLFCLPYFQSLKSRSLRHIVSISVVLAMNVLLISNLGLAGLVINQLCKFLLFFAIFIALNHELQRDVQRAR